MNKKKAVLAVILSVAMAAQTFAVTEIKLGTLQDDYTITKNDAENAEGYLVTGSSAEYGIIVSDGVDTTITLQNASVGGGIEVGAADVTLELDGTNTVSGGEDEQAGIGITSGSLTIQDETGAAGTLTATGGKGGAGIGGDLGATVSGDVTITGGTVTAIGGAGGLKSTDAATDGGTYGGGAGIGTGAKGTLSGTVEISGGTVTATGKDGGAGIGGGGGLSYDDTIDKSILTSNSSLTITGGNTTATGGDTPGVGAGEGDKATDDQLNLPDGIALDSCFQSNGSFALYLDGFPESEGEAEPNYIIKNADGSISAVVNTAAVKALVDVPLTDEETAALIGETEDERVLKACTINYDVKSDVSCNLRFHVGTEYAGRTVEVRMLSGDTVVTKTVTVSAMGLVVLMSTGIGTAFAVVLVD